MSNVHPFDPAQDREHGLARRQPPHNFEIEQALLGAILMDNRLYVAVQRDVRPEHFADPMHGRLFEICGTMVERGVVANPVTLRSYVEGDDKLKKGGADYLVRLAKATITLRVVDIEAIGREIVQLHGRRRLIEAAETLREQAWTLTAPLPEVMSTIEGTLGDVRADALGRRSGLRPIKLAMDEAVEMADAAYRTGDVLGLSTGLSALDKITGGMAKQDLVILAGRPSMGKTSALVSTMWHRGHLLMKTTREQDPVPAIPLFSLEVAQAQIAAKILGKATERSWNVYRSGKATQTQMDELCDARLKNGELPIFIDDTPALSVADIMARLRKIAATRPIDFVGIDYLQLMKADTRRRDGNRVQEISEITAGLKTIAKTFDCPVVALSQLSRKVEEREDKRPQLADLRDSGSIEQDADVVLFVFREEYYLQRAEPSDSETKKWGEWRTRLENSRGVAEIIVEKQRNGPIGTAKVRFTPETQWFDDRPAPAQGDLLTSNEEPV